MSKFDLPRSATWIGGVAVGLAAGLLTLQLGAAPADVVGSPNVPVDTYRNSKGTYVLWANGRITDVSKNDQDLGHPYSAPPAAAKIVDATLAPGQRALGSPNVAIKAIPRPDHTYIMFGDGNLRKPANSDAAAPMASSGGHIVIISTSQTGVQSFAMGAHQEGSKWVFDQPFSSNPKYTVLLGSADNDNGGDGGPRRPGEVIVGVNSSPSDADEAAFPFAPNQTRVTVFWGD